MLTKALGVFCCVAIWFGQSVAAQEITECDWRAHADGIVEPWEEHSRSFGQGAVRLALIDAIEPAAGAFYILVLSPPYDEIGARQCRTIGFQNGIGFAGAEFAGLEASYDPAIGLQFAIEISYFQADNEFYGAILNFTLDQSTGALDAWFE